MPTASRKILAAIDLSPASQEVIDAAVAVARACRGALDVLHVREPFSYATTGGEVPVDQQSQLAHDFVSDALSGISDRIIHEGVPCVTSSLDGSPTTEIVAHADRTDADLIVVGRHGRGIAAEAMLGSVAERVVRRAHRPVLVVPVRDAGR